MHAGAYRFVQAVAGALRARGLGRHVYEIGSRVINGSVRPLFPAAERYHGVDLIPGDGVDVVADGATYTPPFTPDTVLCCEVLEHAAMPDSIVAQAARVLAPGGVLVVTCAAPERLPHSGVDGGELRPGEHYRGVDPDDLRRWLVRAGFVHVFIHHDPVAGDCYATAERAARQHDDTATAATTGGEVLG